MSIFLFINLFLLSSLFAPFTIAVSLYPDVAQNLQKETLSVERVFGVPTDFVLGPSGLFVIDGKEIELYDFDYTLKSSITTDEYLTHLALLNTEKLVVVGSSGTLYLYTVENDQIIQLDWYFTNTKWSDLTAGDNFFIAFDTENNKASVFSIFDDTIHPTITFNTSNVKVDGNFAVSYENSKFAIWNMSDPTNPVHLMDANLVHGELKWFRFRKTMIAFVVLTDFLDYVFRIVDFGPAIYSQGELSVIFECTAYVSPRIWTEDFFFVETYYYSLSNKYSFDLLVINTTSSSNVSFITSLLETPASEIYDYSLIRNYGATIVGRGLDFVATWNITNLPPTLRYRINYGGYITQFLHAEELKSNFNKRMEQSGWYPKLLSSNPFLLGDALDLMVVNNHIYGVRVDPSLEASIFPVETKRSSTIGSFYWMTPSSMNIAFKPQVYNGSAYFVWQYKNTVYISRWNLTTGDVGPPETVETLDLSQEITISAFCMKGPALYMIGSNGGVYYQVDTKRTRTFDLSLESAPQMVVVEDGFMYVLTFEGILLFKIETVGSIIFPEEVGRISGSIETFTLNKGLLATSNGTHVSMYNVTNPSTNQVDLVFSTEALVLSKTRFPTGSSEYVICDTFLNADNLTIYRAAGYLGVWIIKLMDSGKESFTIMIPFSNVLFVGFTGLVVVAALVLLKSTKKRNQFKRSVGVASYFFSCTGKSCLSLYP